MTPKEAIEPIPGYELRKLDPQSGSSEATRTSGDWAAEFETSRSKLRDFLLARDPYVVISKTAMRVLFEGNKERNPDVRRIEQAEAEVLIALFLALEYPIRSVPTSPGNFTRIWAVLERHLAAYVRKQSPDVNEGVAALVTLRARLQTIYYRNLFDQKGCEETLRGLLQRFDVVSLEETGQRLSVTYADLVRVHDLVIARFNEFYRQLGRLLTAEDRETALSAIEFFCSVSPLSRRAWRYANGRFENLSDLTMAGFQLSELAYPWVFTLPREAILAEFSETSAAAIDRLSLRPGELAGSDPDHIYMNNPIWRRPYIVKPDGDLFVPLPHLIFSFPFQIVEALMEGNDRLTAAYAEARADYLEDVTANILRAAMPTAAIFPNVEWDDPATGKRYENDVVALIGNFLFLFEAKSGHISEVARRGGDKSLKRNIRELFVEPGEQAARLQDYLDQEGPRARLWIKGSGLPVDLKLDKPKVVHKFSVCIEHFASLTSAKSYLQQIGLVPNETAWAPVLSLGELLMLSRFLDTELSFVHYLTRRSNLEEVMDFDGDEQDLLSMYLTNGFLLDPEGVAGQKIMFQDADDPVRRPTNPRADRTEPAIHGIPVSPTWQAIIEELYRNEDQRHRFDIIATILNQSPVGMLELDRRMRRWRRGDLGKNNEVLYLKSKIGNRLHVVAVYLGRQLTGEEWTERAREVTKFAVMDHDGPSDFTAFLIARKSKTQTFDGVSFSRGIAIRRNSEVAAVSTPLT